MNKLQPLALLILLSASVLALSSHAADRLNWTVDKNSQLGFEAYWEQEPFHGQFQHWQAQIRFDPKQLQQARFEVQIQMNSADTDNAERDDYLKQAEWFFAEKYPQARFIAERFEATDPGHYLAHGSLKIKAIQQDIALPFQFQQQGDQATLSGEVKLKRTDFKVGDGDWLSDPTIGFDVIVRFKLQLHR